MKKRVKFSPSCIFQAIEIINKLTSFANFRFPIFRYQDGYSIPIFSLVRMVTGIVNKYLVISFHQSLCKMLRKLLEPSIRIWNTPRANNANFHLYFLVFKKSSFRYLICAVVIFKRFVKVSDKAIGYFCILSDFT